jgi:hypothetical protein
MFVHSFYFVSYYFLELHLMIFFKIFRRPIIAGCGRDIGTILRPIQISIQLCGWRWDRLVDPIKIGSTGSPTLRLKTCVRLIVSQPLGALHQYEEFIALKQQYQQLSTNYDELRQIVMEMRSKMGDDTCAGPFWAYGPRNNQPPPPPALPLF